MLSSVNYFLFAIMGTRRKNPKFSFVFSESYKRLQKLLFLGKWTMRIYVS